MALYGTTANAAVMNVEFGTPTAGTPYSGTAAAPDDDHAGSVQTWNQMGPTIINNNDKIGNGTSTPLYNSAGNPMPASIAVSASQNGSDAGGGGPDGAANNLLNYLYYDKGNPATAPQSFFTISGLPTTQQYNLFLYGTDNTSTGALFTLLNGTTATGVSPSTSNTTGGSVGANTTASTIPAGSPNLGADYMEFTGVTPNSSGNIVVQWSENGTATNGAGVINGFQLESVPEPASAGLLAVGAFGLLARKRRRSI